MAEQKEEQVIEPRILIIDDDPIDREFFRVMFPLFGFQIESVEAPAQGLRILKKEEYDLIFIDYHIPGKSAISFVQRIKDSTEYVHNRLTPIMMLTDNRDPENKIEGYEAGVEDYIIKPYNFLEILARVRAVLRTRELARQLVRREHRITLIESLNSSLIYFSRRMREPMQQLLDKAAGLNGTEQQNNVLADLMQLVRYIAESNLAALDSLENEIHELLQKGTRLKDEEVTPELLEEHYRKHFHHHQQRYSELQKSNKDLTPSGP